MHIFFHIWPGSVNAEKPSTLQGTHTQRVNKRIHFIAIGGNAMHNLALAMQQSGWQVTGSDDEIFEPSHSRLQNAGLLPAAMGWDSSRITSDIDIIVLGMHAKAGNPELGRARELGLNILSYPELVLQLCADKQRVVIGGSHGKTTITSMIMHVLKHSGRNFDYLVGSLVPGFEVSARFTPEAPVVIIEGDEYLASAEIQKPKFLLYNHHIGVVSGIAWDHVNVFPTEANYVRQFDRFADATPKGGQLIYNDDDDIASVICKKERTDVGTHGYTIHKHRVADGQVFLIDSDGAEHPIKVFGNHNLLNISAALQVCNLLRVPENTFYEAIGSFQGASFRLQSLAGYQIPVFRDFAHAPSKVKAAVNAVVAANPGKRVAAILELHTYSSLNQAFISQYNGVLEGLSQAAVYFNPAVIEHKKLAPLTSEQVGKAFGTPAPSVFTASAEAKTWIARQIAGADVLLIMTSGNFDGIDFNQL